MGFYRHYSFILKRSPLYCCFYLILVLTSANLYFLDGFDFYSSLFLMLFRCKFNMYFVLWRKISWIFCRRSIFIGYFDCSHGKAMRTTVYCHYQLQQLFFINTKWINSVYKFHFLPTKHRSKVKTQVLL